MGDVVTRAEILAGQLAHGRAERASVRRERLVEFFGRAAVRRVRKRSEVRIALDIGAQGPSPSRNWQLGVARAASLIAGGRLTVAEACTAAITEHVRTRFSRASDLPELVLRMAREIADLPVSDGRSRTALRRARAALPANPEHLPDIVLADPEPDIRTEIQYVLERRTSTGKR